MILKQNDPIPNFFYEMQHPWSLSTPVRKKKTPHNSVTTVISQCISLVGP
jgi:hypothetical protein